MINRRTFVLGSVAGATWAAGMASISAATSDFAFRTGSADSGRGLGDSRSLGWQPPRLDQLDCGRMEMNGKLPDGLRGVFHRNGPAGHHRHGFRYGHWFDGDGMVQAFRFSDSGVAHQGRMIMTPKLRDEDAARRRLYPVFATPVVDSVPLRTPDDMNSANISILDHHGELMALWEGGSASRLDRDTLEWKGFKDWGGGSRGAPFTAHPKVDRDGTLWAFGIAIRPKPTLVLYHIASTGRLVKAAVLPVESLGMVHDFVVTDRHLVIVIPPFVYREDRGETFLDAHVWEPKRGSRALVVSKNDFDDRRWVQLPAGFGFHHGNGWEEPDGTIRFDHCLSADPALVNDVFRRVMDGDFRPASPPTYTRFAIRTDGSVEIMDSGRVAEFPQILPSLAGRRNRFVYTLGTTGHGPVWLPRTLVRQDLDGGSVESFDFGEDQIPEEHVFVPFPEGTAEDDGWLVGPVLAHRRGVSGITVFDARRIADGPVATAWLPYPLPLGFHGSFSADRV